MRNEGLCTESIRAIFCIVTIWPGGPHSPVSIIIQVQWFMYQSHLAVFSIDRNAIDCYDFVRIWRKNMKGFARQHNKVTLNKLVLYPTMLSCWWSWSVWSEVATMTPSCGKFGNIFVKSTILWFWIMSLVP